MLPCERKPHGILLHLALPSGTLGLTTSLRRRDGSGAGDQSLPRRTTANDVVAALITILILIIIVSWLIQRFVGFAASGMMYLPPTESSSDSDSDDRRYVCCATLDRTACRRLLTHRSTLAASPATSAGPFAHAHQGLPPCPRGHQAVPSPFIAQLGHILGPHARLVTSPVGPLVHPAVLLVLQGPQHQSNHQ